MYQGKYSDCVVRIDPTTGHVKGWIDMTTLFPRQHAEITAQPMNNVLNGIAYHPPSRRMYVTGKRWDHMYQITVDQVPTLGPAHVKSVCNLG